MFNLLSGNDLTRLADALADQLARRDRRAILRPERVLVPQAGLRRWLQIHLAERHGIIANVQFSAPAEYVWELLRAADPSLPERSDFSAHLLRWRLLALLETMAGEPHWSGLGEFLVGTSGALKRMQLAGELANVFERYQAYRGAQLLSWQQGADPLDWQAELWRRLVQQSKQPHRAQLLQQYLQRFHLSLSAPPALPERLFVFGCIHVSPDVLRLFGVLAQHCQLDFFQPSPCREYWGDVRSERERLKGEPTAALAASFAEPDNPLLASLGAVGRDFVAQLFSYEHLLTFEEVELYREPRAETLLGAIQTDILDLRAPSPERHPSGLVDPSLQVHLCHSALREVQVLHDQLLEMFARDASLQPRDIAVMAPRVESYAPLVRAVFGAPMPGDPRHIPFTVGDAPAHTEHPIVKLFIALLSLPASRRSASDVLELLRVPAVLRKLDVDAGALEQVLSWVSNAGIRWGTDAAFRAARGAGYYGDFSWAWGLERLLMGYASNLPTERVAGVVPYVEIEGLSADALGKLIYVLRALESLARNQRHALSAPVWQQVLNEALDALLPAEADASDERHALTLIRATLSALADDSVAAGTATQLLDWLCVRSFLTEQLNEVGTQHRFLSGGVNFCGMVPLRTVPFKVICLLGMEHSAFPRQDPTSGINRMHQEYARTGKRVLGDRSLREDDRYLFLQLLCAARDCFYLSYVAQNLRDGSEVEPSVLLSELLEVSVQGYFAPEAREAARAALLNQHPMQPFAKALFQQNQPQRYTYNQSWHAAARVRGAQTSAPVFADAAELGMLRGAASAVTLARLQQFFRNPSRYFLRDCVGLKLLSSATPDLDEDPLSVDALQRYQLNEALVQAQFAPSAALHREVDSQVLSARLLLPAGHLGVDALVAAQSASEALRTRLAQWLAETQPLPTRDLDIQLSAELRMGGQLERCFTDPQAPEAMLQLLDWTVGDLHGRAQLQAWLRFLCLRAANIGERATLFGISRQGALLQVVWQGLSQSDACAALQNLIALYQQGCSSPLPLYLRSAWVWIEAFDDSDPESANDAWFRAKQVFEGGFQTLGERADPWIAQLARGADPLGPDARSDAAQRFTALAQQLYAPMRAAAEVSV